MAALSRQIIAYWSASILDDLAPTLLAGTSSPEALFTKELCGELNTFLLDLYQTPFTRELLKTTQVHAALQEIAALGGGWPEGFVHRAELILERMEKEIGGFVGLGTGLWDEGGPLEGCQEVRGLDGQKGWVVEMRKGKKVEEALATGDLGFAVGSWWINTASALRDGIIGCVDDFLSVDAHRAFAAVLTGGHEMPGSTDDELLLKMTKGYYRLKLMKILAEHKPIRVIRDYRMQSPRAPKVGLRYDGLYMLEKWSVRLHVVPDGTDQWVYVATLSRVKSQESLEKAKLRPNAEELRIYEKFLSERRDRVVALRDVDLAREDIVVGFLPEDEQLDDSDSDVTAVATEEAEPFAYPLTRPSKAEGRDLRTSE